MIRSECADALRPSSARTHARGIVRVARSLRASVCAALILGTAIARAEPPPADRTPERAVEGATSDLTPPSLTSTPDVVYPEGARGEALVVLMLTVGREGAVEAARAIEGEEPFASAATAAALTWKFEPARRQGQPVAARIRFEVRFREPPTGEPGDAETAGAPPEKGTETPGASGAEDKPATPSAPAAGAPTEITVIGERKPVGVSTLTRAEVRQLPGAFGDPFRAIEALPGVTPIVSGIPFFYVRGAPPGNIGYFLDGIRVPYLYHVGLGPSIIHPGMVDRVDLYPGGYPAQFGRFAGGIVAAEATAPRAVRHGEGNIRLFDLGAMAETGFAGGKGTALLAGRYSYTAAILSLIVPEAQLDYRDFEGRVSYDFTPNDRLTVFGFGSYDLIGEKRSSGLNVLFGSEFYRLDTRYDRRLGPSSKLRAAVTFGFDRTKIPDQPRVARNTQVQARVEATHRAAPNAELRGGADILAEAYRMEMGPYHDPDQPQTLDFNLLFPSRNDVTLGAWTDAVLKYPGVTFTPGIRADLYRSGSVSAVGIDPRIASRLEVTDKIRVLHTIGIAHQPPSFIVPIPGLGIGSLRGGLQTSFQTSAGVEIDLPDQTTASFTVFDNVFFNMSDTLGVQQNEGGDDDLDFISNRSLGSAVGAEVYIRRKLTRRLGGFLSYTLSRSTRSAGRERFLSAFDRTHVANLALSFDLGRNWRAGTRFMLYTGIPAQPTKTLEPPPRSLSPTRDPTFYRLDLRLEKRWVYSPTFYLSFIAEIMNATLHKEVLLGTAIGPITIPSLGVEMGF